MLGDAPGWYRYHPLLRDDLLDELDVRDRAAERRLRRRALAWSRTHGRVEDAAAYAVASADWDALARLTDEHQFRAAEHGPGRDARALDRGDAPPDAARAARTRGRGDRCRLRRRTAGAGSPAAARRRARAPERHRYDATIVRLAMALYRDDHVGEALTLAEAAAELAGDQGCGCRPCRRSR